MKRPLLVFLALAVTLVVVCDIKHVPWQSLVGGSSAAITVGGLLALAAKIGFAPLADVFLGRGNEENVRLAIATLALTAALGMTLGSFVIMNNLNNPDALGPGFAAAVIGVIYSGFLGIYVSVVNAKKVSP